MASTFRVDEAALTHPGRVRRANEDNFVARPGEGLWAVCDGMGGHENGAWAARTIAERLAACPLTGEAEADARAAAAAIGQANGVIYAASAADGRPMGSTVVALLLNGQSLTVLWSGDSRAYRLRAGALTQLTRDHSQVADMVAAGLITPEAARHHPLSHVLSRAVGVTPEVELDVLTDEARAGDLFLLCSDGVTGPLDDPEIALCLAEPDLARAARLILDGCLERGAPDNVTVVIVRLSGA